MVDPADDLERVSTIEPGSRDVEMDRRRHIVEKRKGDRLSEGGKGH